MLAEWFAGTVCAWSTLQAACAPSRGCVALGLVAPRLAARSIPMTAATSVETADTTPTTATSTAEEADPHAGQFFLLVLSCLM